jgi:hypothetical protein
VSASRRPPSVRRRFNGGQTIGWTASQTSGSALQIGPGGGSIVAGTKAKATQTVQVTVPTGTPDGLYQVTFHMRSATGTPLPAVVEKIAVSAAEAVRPRLSSPPALARG